MDEAQPVAARLDGQSDLLPENAHRRPPGRPAGTVIGPTGERHARIRQVGVQAEVAVHGRQVLQQLVDIATGAGGAISRIKRQEMGIEAYSGTGRGTQRFHGAIIPPDLRRTTSPRRGQATRPRPAQAWRLGMPCSIRAYSAAVSAAMRACV